jgi:KDO2-lipid IV(A) lauroyltransferase
LKSRLITTLLEAALTLIRLWPCSWVAPLAACFGRLAPYALKRDSRLIASNVRRVYGLPEHSSYSRRFRQQVFQSQMNVMLETFKHNLSTESLMHVEGLDSLRAAMQQLTAEGRGTIIVTAHAGSWEMVAGSVAQASGKRFYALAKPSKLPEFTRVLGRLRDAMNTEVLWTDNKNILREMIKILKAGDLLGFVMDQKPEGRVGPIVDFFGQPTEFVSGPAKLAIRHQCPVLAVFCMRTAPWRYKIIYQVVAAANHGLNDEQVLTQAMAHAIETWIRHYPEQWVWNYKRWRQSQDTPGSSALELCSPV